MIARVWRGRGSEEGVLRYCREHFEPVVLPALCRVPGFAGAEVLAADDEVVVVTRWESLDAVRGFAGEEYETAVVEPVVAELLDSYDRTVEHYTVV